MNTITLLASGEHFSVGKILCLGKNYAEHAKEMGSEVPSMPVVFLKPPSSIIHNGEDIVRPPCSHELHHEVELVVLIGKKGKNISEEESRNYIAGYGVGLDMTLRDVQLEAKKKGNPWTVAKGFDTSAPLSDFIPAGNITDPQNVEIRCSVNGKLRQLTSTSKMIFSVFQTIAYLSTLFTLEPGDLIYTGTPEGVGTVTNGDTIEAELVGHVKISHQVKTIS